MKQIYLRASRVNIWLGHSDEHTAPALRTIRTLAHGCGKKYLGLRYSPSLWLDVIRKEPNSSKFTEGMDIARLEHELHESWHSFWSFYQAEWYFRVWVIQEVSRHVDVRLLCGSEEIEWGFVCLAAMWPSVAQDRDHTIVWRKSHFKSYHGFHHAIFMWTQPSFTRMEVPFLTLLDTVRSFRSTESKDKVFAMLQHPIIQIGGRLGRLRNHPLDIADKQPSTHLNFHADYNVNTLDVYRQVAMSSIKIHRSLEFLNYAWHTNKMAEHVPSWIPRWDVNVFNVNPLRPFLYDAAQRIPPMLRPSPEPNCLVVQGLNISPIVSVDAVLRYQTSNSSNNPTTTGYDEDPLLTLSKLMALDRVRLVPGIHNTQERSSVKLQQHFADFSAYLLPILKAHKQDSYITLATTWCDRCEQFIADHSRATSTPSKSYTCHTCMDGDYDICEKCYSQGKKCKQPDHTLHLTTLPSIWCPFTNEIIRKLETYAAFGNRTRFHCITNASYSRRKCLNTAQGWKGIGPHSVDAGDISVILFGSGVPLYFEKSASSIG